MELRLLTPQRGEPGDPERSADSDGSPPGVTAPRMIAGMPKVSMPPEAALMPNPGDDLIARVVGGPDHTWFYWTGRESVREIERTLAIADRSLDSFQSILDFGCGCGRMLLWMEESGRTRALHGTDVDAEAIAWAREHIPYARLSVNDADPPLPFADGTFDLIFNHSVFTHIDESRQDAWLAELHRITQPGSFLVLSTHGEVALAADPWNIRQRLENEGIVFIDGVHDPDFPLPDWYQNTYHAPWYVFEHWGRWFEIRGYVPGGALGVQDHILLERTPDSTSPCIPLAARPQQHATENRVGELEAQIAEMRSTAAWRWATRYWRMRARLREKQ